MRQFFLKKVQNATLIQSITSPSSIQENASFELCNVFSRLVSQSTKTTAEYQSKFIARRAYTYPKKKKVGEKEWRGVEKGGKKFMLVEYPIVTNKGT